MKTDDENCLHCALIDVIQEWHKDQGYFDEVQQKPILKLGMIADALGTVIGDFVALMPSCVDPNDLLERIAKTANQKVAIAEEKGVKPAEVWQPN